MRVQEEARRKAEEVSAVTTGALAHCALLITAVTHVKLACTDSSSNVSNLIC